MASEEVEVMKRATKKLFANYENVSNRVDRLENSIQEQEERRSRKERDALISRMLAPAWVAVLLLGAFLVFGVRI